MRKHRLGKQLLIVLCVVFIVFLAGCRPSPVLEQIIYEQNHQVDPDTETKTMNDDLENEEPDEDIPSRETVDDSEQTKDESHTAALAGDTDTSDDTDAVYDVEYSSVGELSEPDETNPTEGSASETATGSTEAGGDSGGYAPSGEGEEPGNDGMSADESNGGENAGEKQTGGESGDLDDGSTGGSGYEAGGDESTKPILDASGDTVEVPKNVGTVTAVGEIATMVEMMGGNDRLLASSSSFFENNLVQAAFASQGAANVQCWWDGDGSNSDCNNIKELLEMHPDVCFEISEQETFSPTQEAALNDEGIVLVLLWPLNSIDHIKEDVKLVGQVLGNNINYGTNAENIADDYCRWAENVKNRAGGGSYSSKATTYIADWDDDAYWKITGNGTPQYWDGYGVPIGKQTIGVLEDCMTIAHLTNTASNDYYVEPVKKVYWESTIYPGSKNGRWPKNRLPILSTDEFGSLGNEYGTFPGVIVANSTILNNIVYADNSYYFNHHWRVGYSRQILGTYQYGFDVDSAEYPIATYIAGNYTIWVNPTGLGSWVNGSVESPLEAAWLAYAIQGSLSEGDLQAMVDELYSKFFNGVSTAQVNLSEVVTVRR